MDNKLLNALNNALKNNNTNGKAPSWRYSDKTTGVIILNQALARQLVVDGVELHQYNNGSYKTTYNYATTPEIYKALDALLKASYADKQVKQA